MNNTKAGIEKGRKAFQFETGGQGRPPEKVAAALKTRMKPRCNKPC